MEALRDRIQAREERLAGLYREGREAAEIIKERTEECDQLLIELYTAAEKKYESPRPGKVCLVAQGGYGRRELCARSDIDLLILHDGRSQEFLQHLNIHFLQVLWDAGLEVGSAIRTVRECRTLMDQDMTILASLIDARPLTGERSLFEELLKMKEKYFGDRKKREEFFRRKREENEERWTRYGDSISLLEPNLKEGKGGLRDYHALYWISRVSRSIENPSQLLSKGCVPAEEFKALWSALNFLWRIRDELHRIAGRRLDQLLLEHQETLARTFGFQDSGHFLGVELFMQKYYLEASRIHQITEKAFLRSGRKDPELFQPPHPAVEGPLSFFNIFEEARRKKVDVDEWTLERIEKSVGQIDDEFRGSPEATALFRQMLRNPAGLGRMLGQMNDCGLLGAFLPEFAKLRFRVQHDVYHVYTADVHSIYAVNELGKLAEGDYAVSHPTLTQILKDVKSMDLLSFAILYHDIGKGEGHGHVEKGAPLIREAGRRLGFTEEEQDVLEFLERSHLIMTHLAFRRDLEDQNMIIQFARAMQSLELLNMLYVLTFCDVKGVSPEAMTDWKASLVEYLYLKTREVIQKGSFTKERASTLVPKVLEQTLALISDEAEREKCHAFFMMMPPRYLLATTPQALIRHQGLWERFEQDPIVFEPRTLERESLNEVTLFTWENPSLFARMTGLFTAHHINIIEAQLNLSNKGHALQVFRVTDHEGKPIDDPERWSKIEKDLRGILQGSLKVEQLVDEKLRPSFFKKRTARILPTRVEIDNDLSPYYTVIDIYTEDRVGLLYQITSTLLALGLYIDVSKISTKVDQVADTFYVKDIFGHKLTSQDRLDRIQEVLMKVIQEPPTPGWRPPVLRTLL